MPQYCRSNTDYADPHMQAIDSEAWELAWSEELSVGTPEIDQEHRRFIGRVAIA